MGEAKEVGNMCNGYSRDLLQRLTSTISNHHYMDEHHHQEEESEEIELNLGLSLGGRFGVDPNPKGCNKLLRSSSIAGITTFSREEETATPTPVMFPLGRTSSLPMETEEEWRKRKELQSLRRLEAKRKRTEKLIKLGRDRASLERNCVEEKRVEEAKGDGSTAFLPPNQQQQQQQQHQQQQQQQQQVVFGNGYSPSRVNSLPFGMPNWTSGGMGSVVDSSPNGKAAALPQQQQQQQGFLPPTSQGSLGSHGSSSSGISEFDSRVIQGNCNETKSPARSPASVQSLVEKTEQKPNIAPPIDSSTAVTVKVEVESPSKKPRMDDNVKKEVGMKVMEDMPCVSTKGIGPNGRRIEGFLYRYKKGEEVRIVCVCHGSFLTPAEFVKHAGGGDVAHPLRHIVVTPSASLLS